MGGVVQAAAASFKPTAAYKTAVKVDSAFGLKTAIASRALRLRTIKSAPLCALAKPRFYLQNPRILCRVLSKKKILRFAVLLVVLFVDFGAELDLGSAVALKSTKSLL